MPRRHRVPICEDDRRYVGWNGQRWTTPEALASQHTLRTGEDEGLFAISMGGWFRHPAADAVALPTPAGNLLWECVSLVTTEAVLRLRERGGVDRIVISHPHFYSSMARWSEALGDVPIMLHAAWTRRGCSYRSLRSGVLAWGCAAAGLRCRARAHRRAFSLAARLCTGRGGVRGQGALFVGDSPRVSTNRRGVSFMAAAIRTTSRCARQTCARCRRGSSRFQIRGRVWL